MICFNKWADHESYWIQTHSGNPLSQSRSMTHFEELRARQREEHLNFHQKLIQELGKSQSDKPSRSPLLVSAKSADEQVNINFLQTNSSRKSESFAL
jgi:hypothetical protein